MICHHCGKSIKFDDMKLDPPVIITRKGSRSIIFHSKCFLEVAGENYFPKEISANDSVDQLIDEANKIYHLYGATAGTMYMPPSSQRKSIQLPPYTPNPKPLMPMQIPIKVLEHDLELLEDRLNEESDTKEMVEKKSLFDRFIKWWD